MTFSLIFHYKYSVDSTNTWAKKLNDDRFIHVLYTAYQTAGRGRHQRKWISSPGKNILMTITHDNLLPQIQPNFYSLIAAYTIIKLLNQLDINAYFKWPNDIWTKNGKLCGILPESIWYGQTINKIVLGIGLNVNEDKFPNNLQATSLYIESGKKHNIHKLVRLVSELYVSNIFKSTQHIIDYLWERYIWKNQQVILVPDGIIGIPKGINQKGHLIIQKNDGNTVEVVWGEITLRKI